jgi:hypothetical protein
MLPSMPEKPAPKPKLEDDTYSDEEIAKRMEATVRAMIAMKPQPRRVTDKRPTKTKGTERNKK